MQVHGRILIQCKDTGGFNEWFLDAVHALGPVLFYEKRFKSCISCHLKCIINNFLELARESLAFAARLPTFAFDNRIHAISTSVKITDKV